MLYHDIKYAKQVGFHLDRFKVKKETPFLASARCKICGDSKKKKGLTRFFFYVKGDKVLCMCHNCGYSHHISVFLKHEFPIEYKQYVLEVFANTREETPKAIDTEWIPEPIHLDKITLPLVEHLPDDHIAKQFISDRKIPKYRFMYAEKFFEFASAHKKSFEERDQDHDRIIIPMYDKDGKMFAYQARALHGEEPKYYTVILDPNKPKVFGLDRVDKDKKIYIVEGPIDSLFLDNCIAATSSSLATCAQIAAQALNKNPITDFVLVFDNEPRNPEIVKLYNKAIDNGHQVVIWDQSYTHKDINDAVLNGQMDPKEIMNTIRKNTYSGLVAKLKFSGWVKVNEETCRTRVQTF